MKQLLLVEDDRRLADHISSLVRSEGLAVHHAASFAEIDDFLKSGQTFAAILLDRLLDGGDTKGLVGHFKRRWPGAAVCVLSAINTPLERAELLDLGADDYMGKPFASSELLARLRALMRRAVSAPVNYREVGDLVLNIAHRTLLCAGRQASLTAKEFLVFKQLAEEPGRVFSKTHLLESVWNSNLEVETNVVEATLTNLRRRIVELGSRVQIKNMRHAGYWLEG